MVSALKSSSEMLECGSCESGLSLYLAKKVPTVKIVSVDEFMARISHAEECLENISQAGKTLYYDHINDKSSFDKGLSSVRVYDMVAWSQWLFFNREIEERVLAIAILERFDSVLEALSKKE
jgi:hypothetical protein